MKEMSDQNKRLLQVMKDRGFLDSYDVDPVSGAVSLFLTPDGDELARLIQKLCPSAEGFTNSDIVNLVSFLMVSSGSHSGEEPFLLN
jgi:hypothetical protein